MPYISVTLDVSKFVTLSDVRPEQSRNIQRIFVTLDVSNFVTSSDVRPEQ